MSEEYKKLVEKYWDTPVNPNYEEGLKQISELLVDYPEEARAALIMGFIGSTLFT